MVTGLLVAFSRRFTGGTQDLTLKKALIIGSVQGIAAFPGISRSGSTISAALFMGIEKEKAFAFSFLLSVPAILGADFLEFRKVFSSSEPLIFSWATLMAGFAASFFTGLASLWVLKKMIAKNFFHIFGYYCLAAGLTALILGG